MRDFAGRREAARKGSVKKKHSALSTQHSAPDQRGLIEQSGDGCSVWRWPHFGFSILAITNYGNSARLLGVRICCALLLFVSLPGCGYHTAGHASRLAKNLHVIAIP